MPNVDPRAPTLCEWVPPVPNFYTRAYISIVEYLKTMHNSDNYVIAAHCAEYTEADTGGEYVGVDKPSNKLGKLKKIELFNLLTYKFSLLP